MTTNIRTVSSVEELSHYITVWSAQGYVVTSREATTATMKKENRMNVGLAILLFLLCIFPFIIYMIVCAFHEDDVVVLTVATTGLQGVQPSAQSAPLLSADGRYWWNGANWLLLTRTSLPPGASLSPDAQWWWDGQRWNRLPGDGLAPPAIGP